MSKVDKAGRVLGVIVVGTGIAAVCVVVSVWALARPDADPVTATVERAVTWVMRQADAVLPERTGPSPDWSEAALVVADGDPREGARLVAQFGCGACHTIPGIPRANGSVGPDLTGLHDQAYIAGVLPNRPGDLVNWLQSPPRHAPETVMPDMGVTEAEAEHMAAYLYTLRR
ncbi:c-type cytochrome [Maritimibacter sp. UBA3975]|uniref:c-type cytochrome n=1 Tax=Maritimibacter sp. UBA3975 TaxID=1946833 RepID=UPI0025BE1BC7|nr:c-type cytochrome [Maritimibacter sp. UBA3975]